MEIYQRIHKLLRPNLTMYSTTSELQTYKLISLTLSRSNFEESRNKHPVTQKLRAVEKGSTLFEWAEHGPRSWKGRTSTFSSEIKTSIQYYYLMLDFFGEHSSIAKYSADIFQNYRDIFFIPIMSRPELYMYHLNCKEFIQIDY